MRSLNGWLWGLVVATASAVGWAQPTVTDVAASGTGQRSGSGTAGSAAPSTSQVVTTTTTTSQGVPGVYVPAGSQVVLDNSASLPSSSRPISDTAVNRDGFDLNSAAGTSTIRGNKGSFAITGQSVQAVVVPDVHTVRRGDTLWDLCGHYLGNNWDWPRVWSYNPDIRNPNWIYPGDQIRMRSTDEMGLAPIAKNGRSSATLGSGPGAGGDGFGLLGSSSRVPKDTVFLRHEAYIDDPDKDVLGEVVGANEEQMLLSQGNHTYLDVKSNVDVKVGQLLTLFERSRKPDVVEGARQPPGEIVVIKGTVRVLDFDSKKHVARAEIVESNDVIERGTKVGAIGRRYMVVSPKPSRVTVWARILNGIYPQVYWGSEQLVFVDRGSEDGLAPGNRLLVVRRGDSWRQSLSTTTRATQDRLRLDHSEPVQTEATRLRRDNADFPEEVVGELRIVHAHPWSSLAIVTAAAKELLQGDRAVAREGY